MLALSVHFADVKLFDLVSKTLEDCPGFAHGGIDLAGVADVEA